MLRGALPESATSQARITRGSQLLFGASLVVLAGVMIRSAWICDDALISFRTVDHFVSGEGLRFNLAERVQSYTHPLWLFVLSAGYLVTREAFFGPIAISLVVSGVAVGWLVARPLAESRLLAATAAVGCLLSSKAFVDYTTSGLETPLSYLLVALGLGVHFARGGTPVGRLTSLVLIGSLAFVNRMDSVLLFAPLIAAALVTAARSGEAPRAWVPKVLVAGLPAVGWLAFSVFYYGVPFPNTFYAKLATGIEPELLREQGRFYLAHAFRFDPVTPFVILGALVLAVVDSLRRRRAAGAVVALAIVLQLTYVMEIGGDFMAGRLLAVPFLAAVGLLVALPWPSRAFAGVASGCVLVSLASPISPLRAGSDYENRDPAQVVADRGISDERGFYYERRGLLSAGRETDLTAESHCEETEVVVRSICGELGYEGFTGCRDSFLADRCALSDPLLARMPMIDPNQWRVGHYFRRVPKGYRDSLERDENRLVDPRHRALYEDIRLATRAPLLAPGRFSAIVRLSFAGRSLPSP